MNTRCPQQGDEEMRALLCCVDRAGDVNGAKLMSVWKTASSDVRYDALEALTKRKAVSEQIEEDLILFELRDVEELNRANAMEIAGDYKISKVLERVATWFDDPSWLVRCAAFDAAGDNELADNIPLIEEKLEKAGDREKVSCLVALIKLRESKRDLLPLLLQLIDSSDYHARCAMANSLPDIAQPEDLGEIRSVLRDRLRIETARAVSTTIEEVLTKLRLS